MFEESFTVGAINMQDTIAGFSSRGPVVVDSSFRTKPNISAPGVQVRSAWLDSTYRNANGTSMAGPHVVGVVALMISANPELAGQVDAIEDILEMTARPKVTEQECGGIPGTESWNNTFGHGVVDALAAVEAALLLSATSDLPARPEGELVLYPNPVSSQLNVLTRGDDRMVELVRIYTTSGQLVHEQRNIALPGRIHLRGFTNGLYVVHADQYPPALINIIQE
jgi:subtilisin family serine protease